MNVEGSPLICGTSDKALHAERPNQAPTPKQSSLAMQPHGVTDRLRQFSKKYKSLQEVSLASAQQPMSFQETLPNDRPSFERFLQAMEAQILAAASFLVMDGAVRAQYQRLIHDMSRELMAKVARRELSWQQAAAQASEARNAVLDTLRTRSSPVGRAAAQSIKAQGLSLNALIAQKTLTLFGSGARFDALAPHQRNQVFEAVVRSAGRSNARVSTAMRIGSAAGRSLVFLSVAHSVYEVATAQDKLATAGRELSVSAAGLGGSIAGGALAGLACGPGAPVCVAVGAFVGGALFAFGVASLW